MNLDDLNKDKPFFVSFPNCAKVFTVGYIVLPIALFFLGWLRWIIALPCIILLAIFSLKIIKDVDMSEEFKLSQNRLFWIISILVIAIWVFFSGIGSFSYQTDDFRARNPMFRDLYLNNWPVYYDLSIEPQVVRQFTGEADYAMYVYYFTFWIVPAFFAKSLAALHLSSFYVEALANVFLYLWAVLGCFLAFYWTVVYIKKYSFWILSSFVLFSGLDYLAWFIQNRSLPLNTHIERWAGLFQYSANTTQLYWVFNQSIPVWVIISFLLVIKRKRGSLGWASMTFAYSPFATIGIIPIAIASVVIGLSKPYESEKIKKKILPVITVYNIAIPIVMLVIYGSFYKLVAGKSLSASGLIFLTNPRFGTYIKFIVFIFVEFLLYFVIMGKTAWKYPFYWVTFFELMLIPLIRMGEYNDFCMRVSIPALFILMILCTQSLLDNKNEKRINKRKVSLMVALIIGYVTSFAEIQRNVYNTIDVPRESYLKESIYSFSDFRTDDEDAIKLHVSQYMSLDDVYRESFFYKYLAEKSY